MKKFTAIILSVAFALLFVSCGKTEKSENKVAISQNTVAKYSEGVFVQPVELSQEDSRMIKQILGSDNWIEGSSDCLFDCRLQIDGCSYNYHLSCGTFENIDVSKATTISSQQQDIITKTLRLTEDEKATVNEILEKYIDLSDKIY